MSWCEKFLSENKTGYRCRNSNGGCVSKRTMCMWYATHILRQLVRSADNVHAGNPAQMHIKRNVRDKVHIMRTPAMHLGVS